MPDPAIFFVHIPKTAGLSLYWAMANAFPINTVARFNSEQEFWQAESSRIQKLRLLAAHAHIGFQSIFPQQPFVFTFLRSPLDRTISAYWHLRNESKSRFDNPEFQAIIDECQNRSFEEIIFDDASPVLSQLGNVQTQYLGMEPLERTTQDEEPSGADVPLCNLFRQAVKIDPLTPGQKAAEKARENLNSLPAFGILENMDASLELMRDAIGLDPDNVPQINVGKRPGRESEVSARAVERIRELTSSDQALYDFAVQLLRQRSSEGNRPEIAVKYLQPQFRFDPPAESIECAVADGFIGGGWYPRDSGSEGAWCWNGMIDRSWIDIYMRVSGDLELSLDVPNCTNWDALKRTRLECAGESLETKLQKGLTGGKLIAKLPERLAGRGTRRLRIVVPVPDSIAPMEAGIGNRDGRPLFLAFRCIRVRPPRHKLGRNGLGIMGAVNRLFERRGVDPGKGGPVFVIGSPRSGTTALAAALNEHSALWTSSEAQFLFDLFGDGHWRKNFLRGRGFGGSWLLEQDIDEARFLRYLGRGIEQLFLDLNPAQQWVEHTPANTLIADTLALVFPDARFVHILRDGRRVVGSMMGYGNVLEDQDVSLPEWARDFRAAARTWANFSVAAHGFQNEFPGKCLTIRQEDLAERPNATMENVMSFLGLESEYGPVDYLRDNIINSSTKREGGGRGRLIEERWKEWSEEQEAIFVEEAGEAMVALGLASAEELRSR